ncbi:MAG: AMP-dependent synthetase/ligase [Acidimicrobiia bacterium]
MREYTSPGAVKVPPSDSPIAALLGRADTHPHVAALAVREGNRFVDITTEELVNQVMELAAGLVALGIQPGSRIGVYSATRYEFTYAQYAIWAAGCAAVTLYETSSAEQVRWSLSDSGSVGVFCENEQLKAVFDEVAGDLPDCRHQFVIDAGGLDQIKAAATNDSRAEVKQRIKAIAQDDIALLIYTSGTTGRPKGCVLTQHNFIWDVRQVVSALPDLFEAGNSNLMFLPLAHSFAQVVQVGCVTTGVKIGYSTGTQNLVEEMGMLKPRWVFSVPRVFEKVYNSAKHKADSEGKGRIFDIGANIAIEYSREDQAGKVSLKTKVLHAVFDKLLYGKLRDVFGGRLEYAISGGAALGERLGHFFRGIGLTVLEGYGLTETTAATFFNRPGELKIGTVGHPAPGVSVKIADDGEVLIKGGCVFKGYWNNEMATNEVFSGDGWFHSGDVGELDNEAYLRITGRKKELIVTSGGKNVAPAVLEDLIRAHPLISQCMVIGDAQPFIAALVTLDPETFPEWAEGKGLGGMTMSELRQDPGVLEAIQEAIDVANKAVSKAESVRTFRVLDEDFTIQGGELTPTLKVKRAIIGKKYAHVIDEIYTE